MTKIALALLSVGCLLLSAPIYSSDDALLNTDILQADSNNNGILEASEVNHAIMQYLTGDSTWNEASINRMIEVCLDMHAGS